MKTQELRLQVPLDLNKRFKIICIKYSISPSKQITSLIKDFVDVHEKNLEIMENLEKK